MLYTKTRMAALATAALAMPLAGAPAQVANDTGVIKNPVNQSVDHSLHNSAQEATDTVNDSVEAAKEATAEAIDANGQADVRAQATTPAGAAQASVGATAAATPADVKAGASVHDTQGGMVGTIESVDATGAVIATGKARVQIPLASFAKNDTGLVISLTKAQLEAEAAKAS